MKHLRIETMWNRLKRLVPGLTSQGNKQLAMQNIKKLWGPNCLILVSLQSTKRMLLWDKRIPSFGINSSILTTSILLHMGLTLLAAVSTAHYSINHRQSHQVYLQIHLFSGHQQEEWLIHHHSHLLCLLMRNWRSWGNSRLELLLTVRKQMCSIKTTRWQNFDENLINW